MRASRFLQLLSLVCALVSTAPGPASAGPVKFNFAHFISPIEPGSEVGVWIEKDLNENSGGLVEAKYFHSMQMGSTIELVKKVRMGTLNAAFMTGNYAPDLNPKFGIGTLAYCMDSYEKWEAFRKNDELRDELFTSLQDKGLLVVDMCYFGRYGFATTKPVRTLQDLSAMKMRTTQARYPLAFWKALGVNPSPMAWGDVFPALKQGVIDGTDQTRNVARARLTDLCKYFTETNHMVGLFFLVVNEKWYAKLDPAARDAITKSIQVNFEKARADMMRLTDEAPGALREAGVEVITLPAAEMARFKDAQKGVWQEFEPEIGKPWLDKVVGFTEGL